MKRRSGAGGAASKARGRKTVKLKRRNVPREVARRNSSAASHKGDFARLSGELNEAREQQAATASVLKAISHSTFDLVKVLNTALEAAARLSDADKGVILRPTGEEATYYVAASYRHTSAFIEHQRHLTRFAQGDQQLSFRFAQDIGVRRRNGGATLRG